MPVSGLVVILSSAESPARDAIEWLESDTRFSVGEPAAGAERRVPLTLDTPDEAANRACWNEMQAHDGIAFVDVVCVFFS